MLIIADSRLPLDVTDALKEHGTVFPFLSESNVYEAIRGHPDIFICRLPHAWVLAPEVNHELRSTLADAGEIVLAGKKRPGRTYPETACYNAVVTKELLIHHAGLTDAVVLESCSGCRIIHVKQGYTRCNLIPLNKNTWITSDRGIHSKLTSEGLNAGYFNPSSVVLHGFRHGFLGGAMGIYRDKVFITGTLQPFAEHVRLSEWVRKSGCELITLSKNLPFDAGSLLFAGC